MSVRENDNPATKEDREIHSIDLWFSRRRKVWIVERLDHNGDVIGPVHQCAEEDDARDCVVHWLRAHAEAQTAFHENDTLPASRRPRRQAA